MPTRHRLSFDHATPAWIKGRRIYFITMCTVPRGINQLCQPHVAKGIFAAANHYHAQSGWHVEFMLLMPDHLHALIGFPGTESMNQVISSWKHFLAWRHRVNWQRDYFDHRL